MKETPTQPKNPSAVALARMAKGIPKTLTPQEREARSQRAKALNARLKSDPLAMKARSVKRWRKLSTSLPCKAV